MPVPSDYKHIKAWGIMMSSSAGYIEGQQNLAASEDAPIDAIYHEASLSHNPGTWRRYSDVTGKDTRRHMDRILAEL